MADRRAARLAAGRVDQHEHMIALGPAQADLTQPRSAGDGYARHVAKDVRDIADLTPLDGFAVDDGDGSTDLVGRDALAGPVAGDDNRLVRRDHFRRDQDEC